MDNKDKRVFSVSAETIEEIEDKINEFAEKYEIFSTQPFVLPNAEIGCLIWYFKNRAEKVMDDNSSEQKEELATVAQLNYFRANKLRVKDGLTKKEAFSIIKEHKSSKK